MNRLIRMALLMVCLALAGPALADDEISIPVALRPGVTAQVVVTVREAIGRRGRRCHGRTVVAVHGLAHTAATWRPLVDELLARGDVCAVASIDLPGHGRSPVPAGLLFGQLLLDDHVTAVLGALDELADHDDHADRDRRRRRPTVLLAHSMGGLIVEGVQARLIAAGTSLRARLGIDAAILLSPSPAAEHPWAFTESGAAAAVVAPFLLTDAGLGPILRVDPATWVSFFFRTPAGALAPGAPTAAEVRARGYDSDESQYAGGQLLGLAPFLRLSVGDAPFSRCRGTRLYLVNPSQDPFSVRAEAQAAYRQLTGDDRLSGFVPIDDPDGVHDLHVAQPARVRALALEAIFDDL